MQRAFTLLELMVVVAIVGIAAMLAGPSISQAIRRANEPTEVARLRTFLTESRNIARRANRCVIVDRVDDTTFTRTVVTSCAADDDVVTKRCGCAAPLIAVPTSTTMHLGTGVRAIDVDNTTAAITGLDAIVGDDRILFFANGATPYLDPPTINLTMSASAQTRRLLVMPASGIVRSAGGT